MNSIPLGLGYFSLQGNTIFHLLSHQYLYGSQEMDGGNLKPRCLRGATGAWWVGFSLTREGNQNNMWKKTLSYCVSECLLLSFPTQMHFFFKYSHFHKTNKVNMEFPLHTLPLLFLSRKHTTHKIHWGKWFYSWQGKNKGQVVKL